jgi:ketosteroid isomerase-like protein
MEPQEEAFETVRRWWQAWAERDLPTVQEMLAPDYAEISEMGRFQPLSSPSADRAPEDVTITEWEVFDPVTKVFEFTVVCCYCFRLSGVRGRKSFAFSGRATDVLSRSGERWRFLSHQRTLEPEREP